MFQGGHSHEGCHQTAASGPLLCWSEQELHKKAQTLCLPMQAKPEATFLMSDGCFSRGRAPSLPSSGVQTAKATGLDHSKGKVWASPSVFLAQTFPSIQQSRPARQMWLSGQVSLEQPEATLRPILQPVQSCPKIQLARIPGSCFQKSKVPGPKSTWKPNPP